MRKQIISLLVSLLFLLTLTSCDSFVDWVWKTIGGP